MQVNPNIYDVAYTRSNQRGQSAARLVRYLTRRPLDKASPGRESDWRTLHEDQVFGDSEAFVAAANRRRRERLERHERNGTDIGQDHSPQNVSYVHVVISPASREAFRSEDFGALLEPWIRDRKGRPCPYFAAVHYDDSEGPKVHLAVARDRVQRARELPRLKERTAELIRERETLLELERYPEITQDLEQDHESVREESPMQDRQREEEQREAEEQSRQQEEMQREANEGQREEDEQVEERRRQRLDREEQEEREGESYQDREM